MGKAAMPHANIRQKIRTIPDYPKKGIMFRDITTLLKDADGLEATVQAMKLHYMGHPIDKVAAIEARGFILGAPLACALRVGFVPIRKKGKLPGPTRSRDYELEYGKDTVEIHEDAIQPGENVLLVDDLLATGGTAEAAVRLIRDLAGVVSSGCFVIDLPDLGGRKKLEELGLAVHVLCEFAGH
jgi:adenine phosphoribosyltransferase